MGIAILVVAFVLAWALLDNLEAILKLLVGGLVFLIVFLLLQSMASARLGETRAELVARYGEPVLEKDGALDFVFQGFDVGAFLDADGVADGIGYRKVGVEVSPITNEELDVFLKANAGGEIFRIQKGVYPREWKTDSGKRRAYYDDAQGVFMVTTPEGLKRQQERAKQKAAERLRGF